MLARGEGCVNRKKGNFPKFFAKKAAPKRWKNALQCGGKIEVTRLSECAHFCPVVTPLPIGRALVLNETAAKLTGAASPPPSPARCARGRRDKRTSPAANSTGEKNERGADAEPLYRRPPHIRFYNWHNLSSHIFVDLVKVLNDGTGDCAEIFPILKAFEIIAKQ